MDRESAVVSGSPCHAPIERVNLPVFCSSPRDTFDLQNVHHDKLATSLLQSLLKEIEAKASELEFLTRVKLNDARTSLRDSYAANPLSFLQVMRQLLETERQLVQHAENPMSAPPNVTAMLGGAHGEFMQKFESIQERTQEAETDLKQLREAQESFVIVYHEKYQIDDAITKNPEASTLAKLKKKKEMVDNTLNQKANEILQMRSNLASKMFVTIGELEKLQNCVLNQHLMQWRRQQQLSGNGVPFYNNLDQLQQWCELLAEHIWINRQQLQLITQLRTSLPIPMDSNQDMHPLLTQKITDLLSTLITSTFVVERQPPQVRRLGAAAVSVL